MRLALQVVMQADGDFVDVILLYLSNMRYNMNFPLPEHSIRSRSGSSVAPTRRLSFRLNKQRQLFSKEQNSFDLYSVGSILYIGITFRRQNEGPVLNISLQQRVLKYLPKIYDPT